MPRSSVAIWWARRDLRLADNQALAAALARADRILPVFVVDPFLVGGPHRAAERRRDFLWAGLRALDTELRSRGSRLTVRSGEPARVLRGLVEETGAVAVTAEADVTPYAARREAAVGAVVPLITTAGLTLRPPGELRTTSGAPYTVFTPFKRRWLTEPLPADQDVLPPPQRLAPAPRVASAPVPDGDAPPLFPAGEAEAMRRLAAFTGGAGAPVLRYDERRDRVDLDGTSALSPYLRFGMLSARRAVVAALACGAAEEPASGPGVWLSELVWREFYAGILRAHPRLLHAAFDASLAGVAWRDDPEGLAAWQEGRTGYPIVDAAMRQLAETGWMHNRARMIAASFLVKDLLIDWREGERWFMRQLVDGDPAANNGGWQWTAGTGTDAAPYFRVFSPVRQALRCDPGGAYVRRWLPALRGLAGPAVHEPWRVPPPALEAAGIRLGDTYPHRIVDHRAARERALTAYAAARGRGPSARRPTSEA
jgi:deoxyribodipyrimidine photo-lyase